MMLNYSPFVPINTPLFLVHLAHDISSYILSDMELLLCFFFASLLFSFL
jgi:hypothetical protein